MNDVDDTYADQDLEPEDCPMTPDKAGEIYCAKAGSKECSECPIALQLIAPPKAQS